MQIKKLMPLLILIFSMVNGYEYHEAIEHQDLDKVKFLVGYRSLGINDQCLVEYIDANNKQREDTLAPLHYAILCMHLSGTDEVFLEIIEELLKHPDRDINLLSKSLGLSPLHWAVAYHKLEVVKALLRAEDIDINKEKDTSDLPKMLFETYSSCRPQVSFFSPLEMVLGFMSLAKNASRYKSMQRIAQRLLQDSRISVNFINFLFEHGAKLQLASQDKIVSLIQEYLKVALAVLESNPSCIHLEDQDGNTLLHIALKVKNQDMIKAFLQHNIDPFRRNRYGESVYELASLELKQSIKKTIFKCSISRMWNSSINFAIDKN